MTLEEAATFIKKKTQGLEVRIPFFFFFLGGVNAYSSGVRDCVYNFEHVVLTGLDKTIAFPYAH